MQKDIVVRLENLLEKQLMEIWKPAFQPRLYTEENYLEPDKPGTVLVTLAEDQENELDLLEKVAKENQVNYYVQYNAWDFNEEDLDRAPLIRFCMKTDEEGITVVSGHPVITGPECPQCEDRKETLEIPAVIHLNSTRPLIHLVEITEEGLLLFHGKLLDDFRNENCANGMRIVPCEIQVKNTVNKMYSWVCPENDLGWPVGNITYMPCTTCGFKTVQHWRTYLPQYSSKKLNGADFAVADTFYWFPYISQKVYQVIRENCNNKEFERLSFAPCALDDH